MMGQLCQHLLHTPAIQSSAEDTSMVDGFVSVAGTKLCTKHQAKHAMCPKALTRSSAALSKQTRPVIPYRSWRCFRSCGRLRLCLTPSLLTHLPGQKQRPREPPEVRWKSYKFAFAKAKLQEAAKCTLPSKNARQSNGMAC